NLIPALMHELAQAALDGDLKKAREIHYRLAPFFKAEFCDGNPTSIKYAMNYKKMPAGPCRLPLVEVTDAAKKTIEAAIKECNL
nr:dihydrodipicolinate synthase family protein [Treponema sp.]